MYISTQYQQCYDDGDNGDNGDDNDIDEIASRQHVIKMVTISSNISR